MALPPASSPPVIITFITAQSHSNDVVLHTGRGRALCVHAAGLHEWGDERAWCRDLTFWRNLTLSAAHSSSQVIDPRKVSPAEACCMSPNPECARFQEQQTLKNTFVFLHCCFSTLKSQTLGESFEWLTATCRPFLSWRGKYCNCWISESFFFIFISFFLFF